MINEKFNAWKKMVGGNAQLDMELEMSKKWTKLAWEHQQKIIDELNTYIKKITKTDLGAQLDHCEICERLGVLSFNRCRDCGTVYSKLVKMKSIIDELMGCVEFYANKNNWSVSRNPILFNIMETCDEDNVLGIQTSGKRARKCLEKLNK